MNPDVDALPVKARSKAYTRFDYNASCRRVGFLALVTLAALLLTGCTSSRVEKTKWATQGWEDHRFANQPRPYDRLLVEIDAVEGAGPTPHELAELKTFLEQWTHKPGGITIKVDDIIPRHVARGNHKDALALQYLDGPTDDKSGYLYILYYRSKLAGLSVKPDQPHFTYFPYPCAVYIDRSYGFYGLPLLYSNHFRRAILLHEIGHALGLSRNSAHSKDGHCQNAPCVMQPAIIFNGRRFITLRQSWQNTELCVDCRQNLTDYKVADSKPNERLWHGYFVHETPIYQVVTRPGFIYLHVGEAADLSLTAVNEARQTALISLQKGDTYLLATSNSFEFGEHLPALEQLRHEKSSIFADMAESYFTKSAGLIESMVMSEPDSVRTLPWDALIAAAAAYPAAQATLTSARLKLENAAPPAPATANR